MHKLSLILAFLAALTLTACVGLGGGSSSDTSTSASTSTSLSDNARRGPKVSDSEITASIKDAFKQDDLLSNASITVTSDQGVVSMSGRLTARAANRAMSLARAAPGVYRVVWSSIDYIPE
ncbi:BON domain-containing protein [Candidatus Competibacter phosphatis]|uniref:BON domain-containing protein n=1 Tax=Candidatus Competibacter phosphatis TaxID=221280 RepID=A0ABX1TKJ7_9GAMM|nr:BON domain-containing protein [Candidatus Competibacter phosphatis]NMQ18501.1 BON domain-containing protein [Candidatus Competibacter phosphatis]